MLTDGAVRTDSGKLFQIRGAAELKARLAIAMGQIINGQASSQRGTWASVPLMVENANALKHIIS